MLACPVQLIPIVVVQNANAGMLPPSDSEEDSEEEDKVPPLASEKKAMPLQQTSAPR